MMALAMGTGVHGGFREFTTAEAPAVIDLAETRLRL